MPKKPKIEHDYDAGKDKLTVTIRRYSLTSRKTRDAIMEKLIASLESRPERLLAGARKISKDDSGRNNRRGQQKASDLIEIGD